MAVYLFNHSNCNRPFLEIVYLFLSQKKGNHPFFDVYCAAFICFTNCCHSLSLIAIRYHSLSLSVTRCQLFYHSLSLLVIRCTTHRHLLLLVVIRRNSLCHSLPLDAPLVCLCINEQVKREMTVDM